MGMLMTKRRLLIPVATLFVFAVATRLLLLGCVTPVLRVHEFADDFYYYRVLLRDPTMLVTGQVPPDLKGGVIYAPLMPLGIAVPGSWFGKLLGLSIGQRLGMILYDSLAVTLAMALAWRATSPPSTQRQWLVALALVTVPGAALASAVWGQEDTLSAAWGALTLLALATGRPVLAALLAGFGVFTIKMFAVLVAAGIWMGTPGRRRAIAVGTVLAVTLFILFILLRWYASGVAPPPPSYNAVINSPSLSSLFYYAVRPVTFQQVQPVVLALTFLVLGLLAWRSLRSTPPTATAAVVSVHAAFFFTFIGIQPEHHQWFMPFLLFLAWSAYKSGEVALPIAAWSFSLWAYGYKIAFGLQGTTSASSAGKDVFRNWFTEHVENSLFPIQILMMLLTLATAGAVCVLSFRFGVRQRRAEEALASTTPPPSL